MRTTAPNEHAATPPVTAGVLYYPAQFLARFPTVGAALASIGCTGEAADLHLTNAKANASPMIAVPVNAERYPADLGDGDLVAVVMRKPGGRATLWLGVIGLADADREAVIAAARAFSEATGGTWSVVQWVRQTGALQ